jgi:hypothetical protein
MERSYSHLPNGKGVLLVILSTACTPASTSTTLPDQEQSITFETEDGVQIAGTLYGTGKIAVILAHQGSSNIDPNVPVPGQSSWKDFALTWLITDSPPSPSTSEV